MIEVALSVRVSTNRQQQHQTIEQCFAESKTELGMDHYLDNVTLAKPRLRERKVFQIC